MALSKTTTRRVSVVSIRTRRSWRAWKTSASTTLKGGSSNTALQYAGVSSTTRMGAVFGLATISPPLHFDRAGRCGDLLVFVRAHAGEGLVGNAQSHEEISLESQSFSERGVDRIADKTLDVGERFRRMRAEPFCNFHRAIDGLAADGFVHKALLFGVTRIERPPHKDVHEGRRRSDDTWQPLCATGAGQQTEFGLGQTDQIVTVLSDAKVTRKRELEGPGKSSPGNRSDDRLGHGFAQRHCLVEESVVVGCVVRPLPPGGAHGFGEFDKGGDAEMTVEIARSAAGHDHNADVRIACEFLQILRERIAHFGVEIHPFRAT